MYIFGVSTVPADDLASYGSMTFEDIFHDVRQMLYGIMRAREGKFNFIVCAASIDGLALLGDMTTAGMVITKFGICMLHKGLYFKVVGTAAKLKSCDCLVKPKSNKGIL